MIECIADDDLDRVSYEQAVAVLDAWDEDPTHSICEFAFDLKRTFGQRGRDLFADYCGAEYEPDSAEISYDEFVRRALAEFDAIDVTRSPSQYDRLFADEIAFAPLQKRRDEIEAKPLRERTASDAFFLIHGREPDSRELELRQRNTDRLANMVKSMTSDHTDGPSNWIRDVKGTIESNNPDNVRVLLGICGLELRWNCWLERVEIISDPDCRSTDKNLVFPKWTPLDDLVVLKLAERARRTKTRFNVSKEFLWDSLIAIAHNRPEDPAVETLDELECAWDGTPRLDQWLSQSCGVPLDAYHRAVARNVIGGMVKRIRKPGAKHDETLLLIGKQGAGKSNLARSICPDPAWFDDNVLIGDAAKELVLALAGKAVVEFSELSGRRADVEATKAMLSRTTDRGRTAYARSVTERPRRNIFIGSTNDETALVDQTGNRRFLPVTVSGEVDLTWLHENIAQIIGEAAHYESRGDTFAMPRDVWSVAAEHQEAARSRRPVEIFLAEWFAPTDLDVFITGADLANLVNSVDPHARNYTKTIRALGFLNGDKRVDGKTVKIWYRGAMQGATRYVPRLADGRLQPRLAVQIETPTPGQIPLPAVNASRELR